MQRPIETNPSLHLPHYNMNSSTASSQFNGYEHTTIVNFTSDDSTLPGGIMSQEISQRVLIILVSWTYKKLVLIMRIAVPLITSACQGFLMREVNN